MSDTARRRNRRDIDISTSGTAPGPEWSVKIAIWGVVAASMFALYWFQVEFWIWLLVIVGILIGVIAWLVVTAILRRGFFTWMRAAQIPIRLMASGDAAGAQAAFERALARANRFAPDDHRRGMMLCELAMFVKNQGRMAESIAMYEDSAGILAQHLASDPLDYFVVLNNYAICFIHLRDFQEAQKLLEKALDLTLAARKHEASTAARMPLQQVQWLQFVLHLNLTFLFLEMHELGEADGQLREAETLAPLLSKRNKQIWHDHYLALCAAWEFESGNLKAAEKELAEAQNPNYSACVRIRGKVALARQHFAEAEQLARKYLDEERKKGTLHRPELFKTLLDLAESQFGLDKHEEAFASLQEARSIVADFSLPTDSVWRTALQTWLQRARALNKSELAASLQAGTEQLPAADAAIVVLDRLRASRH